MPFFHFIYLHISLKKRLFLQENNESIFVKIRTKLEEELHF